VTIVVIYAIFDIRKALSTPKGTAIETGGLMSSLRR
jgi:hypothetical protein